MKTRILSAIVAAAAISTAAHASLTRVQIRRVLDYKTHQVTCIAEPSRLTFEMKSASGETVRNTMEGEFFDGALVAQAAKEASQHKLMTLIHVRENIPNVTVHVGSVLIIKAASHTLLREGEAAEALLGLTDRLCGPAN